MKVDTPNMFNPGMKVEIKDKWAEKRTYSHQEGRDDNAFSFDNINVWSVVLFKGRDMMVTAKGDDVHPEEGRQMVLDAMDTEQPQRLFLNEDWVDLWLNMRVMLVPRPSTLNRGDH